MKSITLCIVLVDRANYGRLKPVMCALRAAPEVKLQVICAGSMVLERFANTAQSVRADGFEVNEELSIELEGAAPLTMAKSTGLGMIEFAGAFARLRPDYVVVIGDRYEALAAAISAAMMNVCVIHFQGGEQSSSIDESVRHAISKFAHYHFPSTAQARRVLLQMGEREETILGVGCPSVDLAREALQRPPSDEALNQGGSGAWLKVAEPFMVVIMHPITTAYAAAEEELTALLTALEQLSMQTLWLWPNIDAGSTHMHKRLRRFRDEKKPQWLRMATHFAPEVYLSILAHTACAIGNSSSFVRDASSVGTPVVLVGSRQTGREHGSGVQHVTASAQAIVKAARAQCTHGRYPLSTLYGEGQSAQRFIDALRTIKPYAQKSSRWSAL